MLQLPLSFVLPNRIEAIATLNLYFSNSVGIGEHSKILEEINTWTSKLSEAEENLSNLKKYFPGGDMNVD